jgi:predicted nucleic acid-binding Zn ribbon protein
MALTTCHECGAQISTDADKCPRCGAITSSARSRNRTTNASALKISCGCMLIPVVFALLMGLLDWIERRPPSKREMEKYDATMRCEYFIRDDPNRHFDKADHNMEPKARRGRGGIWTVKGWSGVGEDSMPVAYICTTKYDSTAREYKVVEFKRYDPTAGEYRVTESRLPFFPNKEIAQ